MLRLSVASLNKAGSLEPGACGGWHWPGDHKVTPSIRYRSEVAGIRLLYKARQPGKDWQDMDCLVPVEWTPCPYGGQRPWFRCPYCNRRVAFLFGAIVFACRHCHHLSYDCQHESSHDRKIRQSEKIRQVLGWERGLFNTMAAKPKWMRWQTFERLVDRHDALSEAIEARADAMVSKLHEKLLLLQKKKRSR